MIEFHIPIRTVTGLNAREHHMARARRVKRERNTAYYACPAGIKPPCTITLTRISPATRQADDDNVAGALKGCRDAIAQRVGIDDGDPRLTWRYAQRRGPWGVDVQIEQGDAA